MLANFREYPDLLTFSGLDLLFQSQAGAQQLSGTGNSGTSATLSGDPEASGWFRGTRARLLPIGWKPDYLVWGTSSESVGGPGLEAGGWWILVI